MITQLAKTCLSTKLWQIPMMEYMQWNETKLLICPMTWMALKYIILKQRSQTRKAMCCMSLIYIAFWKKQNYRDANRSVVAKAWGWGTGLTTKWQSRTLFSILITVMVTLCVETNRIKHQRVNFTIHNFFLISRYNIIF